MRIINSFINCFKRVFYRKSFENLVICLCKSCLLIIFYKFNNNLFLTTAEYFSDSRDMMWNDTFINSLILSRDIPFRQFNESYFYAFELKYHDTQIENEFLPIIKNTLYLYDIKEIDFSSTIYMPEAYWMEALVNYIINTNKTNYETRSYLYFTYCNGRAFLIDLSYYEFQPSTVLNLLLDSIIISMIKEAYIDLTT